MKISEETRYYVIQDTQLEADGFPADTLEGARKIALDCASNLHNDREGWYVVLPIAHYELQVRVRDYGLKEEPKRSKEPTGIEDKRDPQVAPKPVAKPKRKTTRAHQTWTPKDDRELVKAIQDIQYAQSMGIAKSWKHRGLWQAVADRLGRSRQSVQKRAYRMGINRPMRGGANGPQQKVSPIQERVIKNDNVFSALMI